MTNAETIKDLAERAVTAQGAINSGFGAVDFIVEDLRKQLKALEERLDKVTELAAEIEMTKDTSLGHANELASLATQNDPNNSDVVQAVRLLDRLHSASDFVFATRKDVEDIANQE